MKDIKRNKQWDIPTIRQKLEAAAVVHNDLLTTALLPAHRAAMARAGKPKSGKQNSRPKWFKDTRKVRPKGPWKGTKGNKKSSPPNTEIYPLQADICKHAAGTCMQLQKEVCRKGDCQREHVLMEGTNTAAATLRPIAKQGDLVLIAQTSLVDGLRGLMAQVHSINPLDPDRMRVQLVGNPETLTPEIKQWKLNATMVGLLAKDYVVCPRSRRPGMKATAASRQPEGPGTGPYSLNAILSTPPRDSDSGGENATEESKSDHSDSAHEHSYHNDPAPEHSYHSGPAHGHSQESELFNGQPQAASSNPKYSILESSCLSAHGQRQVGVSNQWDIPDLDAMARDDVLHLAHIGILASAVTSVSTKKTNSTHSASVLQARSKRAAGNAASVLQACSKQSAMLVSGAPASPMLVPGAPASSMLVPGAPASAMLVSGAPAPPMLVPGAPAPSMLVSGAPAPAMQVSGAPAPPMLVPGAPASSIPVSGAPALSMLVSESDSARQSQVESQSQPQQQPRASATYTNDPHGSSLSSVHGSGHNIILHRSGHNDTQCIGSDHIGLRDCEPPGEPIPRAAPQEPLEHGGLPGSSKHAYDRINSNEQTIPDSHFEWEQQPIYSIPGGEVSTVELESQPAAIIDMQTEPAVSPHQRGSHTFDSSTTQTSTYSLDHSTPQPLEHSITREINHLTSQPFDHSTTREFKHANIQLYVCQTIHLLERARAQELNRLSTRPTDHSIILSLELTITQLNHSNNHSIINLFEHQIEQSNMSCEFNADIYLSYVQAALDEEEHDWAGTGEIHHAKPRPYHHTNTQNRIWDRGKCINSQLSPPAA